MKLFIRIDKKRENICFCQTFFKRVFNYLEISPKNKLLQNIINECKEFWRNE